MSEEGGRLSSQKGMYIPQVNHIQMKMSLNSQSRSSFLNLSSHLFSPKVGSDESRYAAGVSPMAVQNSVYIWGDLSDSQATRKRLKVIDLIICYILCVNFPFVTLKL